MITVIIVSFLSGTCSTYLYLKAAWSQELDKAIFDARLAFAEEIHQDLI